MPNRVNPQTAPLQINKKKIKTKNGRKRKNNKQDKTRTKLAQRTKKISKKFNLKNKRIEMHNLTLRWRKEIFNKMSLRMSKSKLNQNGNGKITPFSRLSTSKIRLISRIKLFSKIYNKIKQRDKHKNSTKIWIRIKNLIKLTMIKVL